MPKERKKQSDVSNGKFGLRVLRGYYNDLGQLPESDLLSISEQKNRGKEVGKTSQRSILHMGAYSSWVQGIERAVRKSCDFLFETQHLQGYWWAELESNVTITSEYLMFFHLLGCVDPKREDGMVKHLLHEQRSNGSWGLYHGDEGDLSTSVEAYFALKLAGRSPESDPLRRAREFILQRGGIESSRVFTKIWLALFSQYDWKRVPSMPVELMLLSPHLGFSIYEFSSWARSTLVPLSIIMALRPMLVLPPEKGISELYGNVANAYSDRSPEPPLFGVFSLIDCIVKWLEKRHPAPMLREKALSAAENWILEHQEESGDWGGIQPCMINSILALYYLGRPLHHPGIVKGLEALRNFCFEDQNGLRLQSCVSPVWDTALNCIALRDAGVPADHPNLRTAASWLVRNQIDSGGDWQIKNCCSPGGWAFEFANSRYPDVDDSAVVLMALQRLQPDCPETMDACKQRGLDWCLSMQCSCGGWAAFDKNNTLTLLNHIPFADHEAMVDYPTADITGRMLEVMGNFGLDRLHPRAQRGIEFIRRTQEKDGCWWGRWGVNYIYGTWSVLRGLIAIGEAPNAPYIQLALQWLKDHQNPDGGWGETCESYRRPELRGQGPSTPSQTAWASMALLTACEAECPEVQRGIGYLLRNQEPDGSWEEAYFTGAGFPKHFYIRYHNYRNCFPLMALGQYRQKLDKGSRGC
jgi:squalene-hopene/tetraprenyl-beta-curcumene cyclase